MTARRRDIAGRDPDPSPELDELARAFGVDVDLGTTASLSRRIDPSTRLLLQALRLRRRLATSPRDGRARPQDYTAADEILVDGGSGGGRR